MKLVKTYYTDHDYIQCPICNTILNVDYPYECGHIVNIQNLGNYKYLLFVKEKENK